ncbi:MAG: S53 family peptidase [Gemmataceae bacterium]
MHRSPRRENQPIHLTLEPLEERVVPSTSAATAAQPGQILTVQQSTFQVAGAAASGILASTSNLIVLNPNGSPSPSSNATGAPYTPAQIQRAYGFNQIAFNNGSVKGDGSGQTIAIVDAYNDPNIANDLHQFDVQFGLPDPNLTVLKQTVNGQTTGVDPTGGWETEESLDVEWAHAMAPAANIILVEAYDPSYLFTAVSWAAAQPGVSVVSMSWGGGEFADETSYDSTFTTPAGHQGVTFVASSGDHGTISYPASSPNVLAVGGTSLSLNNAGAYASETVWNNNNGWSSGGGVSAYEGEPSYQRSVQNTGMRTSPDVAYNADPNTGVWVYDSYDTSSPWQEIGGTSAGAPQWAGLIAIADQGRALEGKGTLDGPSQTLPMIYGMSSAAFHDITSGSNGSGFAAGPGYDEATGRGSPYADRVVAALTQQLLTRGYSLSTVAGQSLSGTVATFADYSSSVASYTAYLNWGDGTTSTGQILSLGNGQYAVVGTTSFTNAGSYTLSIQVQGSDGSTATINDTVQVAATVSLLTPTPSPSPAPSPTPTDVPSASPSPSPSSLPTPVANPKPITTPLPVSSPPPASSPPPVLSPPPPSPLQLFLDGITLAIDISESGGLSAALTNAALMNDINAASGGFYNSYLDAGFFAALSNL